MADPYRVCIVEDDDLVRDGLKQMVQASSIFECVGDFSKAEDLILVMMELKGMVRQMGGMQYMSIREPGEEYHIG